VDELSRRIRRASESILENESLTAGLDDPAAQALLDWGLACAERVAESTALLTDEDARAAMSPRLRATRRLMRRVREWIVHRAELGPTAAAQLLAEIVEQATLIDPGFTPPDDDRRAVFLRHWQGHDSPQMIADLCAFIQGAGDAATIDPGETHD
jgi:hypothetical protein